MNKTLFSFFFLSVAFIIVSCRGQRELINSTSKTQNYSDTSIVSRLVRDTIISIEEDSSFISFRLGVDDMGEVQLEHIVDYRAGNYSPLPEVKIKGNVLMVRTFSPKRTYRAELYDTKIERVISTQTAQNTLVVKERNPPTSWLSKFWLIVILIILSVIFFLWRRLRRCLGV